MTNLVTIDTLFDSLFRRSVGLDGLERFSRPMASFPPYNIERINDTTSEIHIALAGYSKDDIRIFERNGVLHVESDGNTDEDSKSNYSYRGIAKRKFVLTYALGSTVTITGAAFQNGMLIIRVAKSSYDDKLVTIDDSLPMIEDNSSKSVLKAVR